MARPVGTEVVSFDVRRAIKATQAAMAQGFREVAADMAVYLDRQVSRPYPPASKPGQYPHIRSGEFAEGVTITGTVNGIRVYSAAPHGIMLQTGTVNMDPRPWATKLLNARDWEALVKKKARAHM